MLMKTASLVEADAEGGQAAQQGADAVHLVGAKAQSAGGYEVVGPVVYAMFKYGFKMPLPQGILKGIF